MGVDVPKQQPTVHLRLAASQLHQLQQQQQKQQE